MEDPGSKEVIVDPYQRPAASPPSPRFHPRLDVAQALWNFELKVVSQLG
jgi:hypothetical protein